MAARSGFKYNHETKALELYVNGVLTNNIVEAPAPVYYVNKATGSSTNTGLSWSDAFEELNDAILVSEAARIIQWKDPTDNSTYGTFYQNARPTIIVQGVYEDYDPILIATNAVEPWFTDIVGLSGWQRSTMMGQTVIGHHDGTNYGFSSTVMLGSRFINLQFEGGTASLTTVVWDQSMGNEMLDCSVVAYASGECFTTGTGTYFAGNHIARCMFELSSGASVAMVKIQNANPTDNVIEDCDFISASSATYGLYLGGGGTGNVVKNCRFYGGTMTTGLYDANTDGTFLCGNRFGANCTTAFYQAASKYADNIKSNAETTGT